MLSLLGAPDRASPAPAPLPTPPFGYDEHCRVSNRGFVMAVRHVERAVGALGDPALRDRYQDLLLRVGRAFSAEPTLCAKGEFRNASTYGHLVSRVDEARSPEDFYGSNLDEMLTSDSIPWAHIRDFSNWITQLRAWHENGTHFQSDALDGFERHHDRALELAADGKLLSALVQNAFADHYLEDQYAPGHIVTPRSTLHDVTSNSLHDQYNRIGLSFRALNTGVLAELLDWEVIDGELATALEAIGCGAPAVRGCLQRLEESPLILRGDGQMADDPRQELFITLIVARSVLDVFEAFAHGSADGASSFSALGWTSATYLAHGWRSSKATWTVPIATTDFGEYVAETRTGDLELASFLVLQPSWVGGTGMVQALFPWLVSPPGFRREEQRREYHLLSGLDWATGGVDPRALPIGVTLLRTTIPWRAGSQFGWEVGYRWSDDERLEGFHAEADFGWGYMVLFAAMGAEYSGGRLRPVQKVSFYTPTFQSLVRTILEGL